MNTALPPLADSYLRATNDHDAATFIALFADDALVDDNFREIRGRSAIEEWSNREIFGAQVTLDPLDFATVDDHFVITTKVDGTFDRTGLPDPVIINHDIEAVDGRIVRLTCRLAEEPSRSSRYD